MLKDYPKTRLALYIVSLALMIGSYFAIDLQLDYADALVKSAVLLGGASMATAATNTRTGGSEPDIQD